MPSEGPNSAGLGGSISRSGATVLWSGPNNILNSDDSYATAVAGGVANTHFIGSALHAFAIATGMAIVGILAEIELSKAAGVTTLTDSEVYLSKDGTNPIGHSKAGTVTLTTTDTYYSYGGATDLWGITWTADEINASTFGLFWSGVSDGAGTFQADHVRITVYYADPAEFSNIYSQSSYVAPRPLQWNRQAVIPF
jgi:hypothetical protein